MAGRGGYGGRGRGMGSMGIGFPGANQYAGPQQNPYVSIAMLDEDIPLQTLFTLLEVWGNVVYLKRNFQKPLVVTAKFGSNEDASAAAANLKRTPIGDRDCEISGRIFGHFENRPGFQEPTDDGDPTDTECKQFHFANSRHRMSGNRSRLPPSDILKVTNVNLEVNDEGCSAVKSSFEALGLTPVKTECAPDGNGFHVQFGSVRDAVRGLTAGQGRLCGEERSNIVFAPREKAALAPAAVAASPVAAPLPTEDAAPPPTDA